MAPNYGLSPEGFARFAPFHFVVNEDDRFVQIGSGLERCMDGVALGVRFGDVFRVTRPRASDALYATYASPPANELVLVEVLASGLVLRGQLYANEGSSLIFSGTPWISSADRLTEFGLRLSDFPPADPTLDILHLSQTDRMGFSDFQDLASSLKKQKDTIKRHYQELLKVRDRLAQQEKEARKLANVASLTTNAVEIADAQGRVEWVNASYERLTGCALEEVMGRPIGERLQCELEQGPLSDSLAKLIRDGAAFKTEAKCPRKGGESYWVEVEALPVLDESGIPAHYILVAADISERKREATILLEAKREAERANRAKSDFLATLSHEIRTPMNGIMGMADLLLESELPPEQEAYAESIAVSSKALLKVINDVLDLSAIESGSIKIESEPFELSSVLDEVLEVLSYVSLEKGIELAACVDPKVPERFVGDAGRLRQVLLNLAGNAIKFTERGHAAIRVGLGDLGDRDAIGLRFEIEDSGVGLEGIEVDRLFESFTQANTSSSRRYSGMGLGLSISKRLVEAMGGQIGGHGNNGAPGSTFWFEAPFLLNPGNPAAETAPSRAFACIVGAPCLMRESLRMGLQRAGWTVALIDGFGALSSLPDGGNGGGNAGIILVMPDAEAAATEEAVARVEARLGLSRSARALVRRYSGAAVAQVDRGPFHWEVNLPIKNATIAALGRKLGEGKKMDTKNAPSTSKSLVDGEPFEGMKILLAEDHPINQKLALSLLGKMGLEADVANNGLEALEALERDRYDVILMDCQMPGMDGFEATRRIRAAESEGVTTGARRRYIIAVTANAMAGDREICLETGMDDYLSKPISKEGLRAALSRVPREEATEPADSASEAEFARPEYEAKVAAIRAHLNQLVEDLGGESVSELVESFVEEAPEKMDELESTIASGDSNQIREVTHAFKSVCGIYGFEEMRLMLQAIENKAKAGEPVEGELEMARLRQTYRECSPVLDEFRALTD